MTADRITFLETGSALVCAYDLWRDPLCGYRARPQYWAPVPEDVVPAVPGLMAGEWIDYSADCYPSLAKVLKERARLAYARQCPWMETNPYAEAPSLPCNTLRAQSPESR